MADDTAEVETVDADAPDAAADASAAPDEAEATDGAPEGDAPEEEAPEDDAPAPFSTPRLESIRAPISGDAPGGIDMKYEDDFQELKAEVDALGAATGDVDFDRIVDLSTTILSERSKDLTVAGYLILGLTRTQGYAGVAEGLAAVRAVTEGFWEDAFPPLRRMRGRQAALQFVAERTSAWVKDEKATPADRESLEQALTEIESLQAFVMEAMGDQAPAFSGLGREVREALRRLPKPKAPEPDPPPAAAASPGAAPQAAAQAAPAAQASGSPGESASYSTVSEAEVVAVRVAGFLRSEAPFSATAVSILRAVRWDAIAQPPPTGVIPPPREPQRKAFEAMATSGNHAGLVTQAEGTFSQPPFHFWLDLQRLTAAALKALGAPAAAALAALETHTAAFVRRLPALPTLTFQDGTPFADPLTISWLDEIAMSEGGGGGGATSASDAAIQEAREQAATGDVAGAVASLMAGAGAPRDRFERAVTAAELCLGAGRPDVAVGLLDGAEDDINTYRLDVWDPAMASRALRVQHASCTGLILLTADPARKKVLLDRAETVFNRLTRIDPAHAMRATKPPKA